MYLMLAIGFGNAFNLNDIFHKATSCKCINCKNGETGNPAPPPFLAHYLISLLMPELLFHLHNVREFLNGVFFGFNCFNVVNLNGFFQSFFRSRQIEFSRNFYIFTYRNGALLCNESLCFFAEQVIYKFF